jgi:hypothetical protein
LVPRAAAFFDINGAIAYNLSHALVLRLALQFGRRATLNPCPQRNVREAR